MTSIRGTGSAGSPPEGSESPVVTAGSPNAPAVEPATPSAEDSEHDRASERADSATPANAGSVPQELYVSAHIDLQAPDNSRVDASPLAHDTQASIAQTQSAQAASQYENEPLRATSPRDAERLVEQVVKEVCTRLFIAH